MVNVDEEVDLRRVSEQTDPEQSASVDVERLYQVLLLILDVAHRLYRQRECLGVVDGLLRVAIVVQTDAGEQRGMIGHSCLDSLDETLFVQTAVEDVHIGYVIIGLAFMAYAFSIDAGHRFA